jgi:hypothetical protein
VSLQARIWLDEVEITSWVLAKDRSAGKSQGETLPEWVESSVKGAGFFDWQVKDFAFRLLPGGPVTPQIGQAVRVLIAGTERFSGVVDGIEDATSRTPRLVCQPPAVTLKDTMAGTPGVNPLTNEERFYFEIPRNGALSIQAAAEAVLARYNANKDDRLPSRDWRVVVQGDETDFLLIHSPFSLTGPVAGSALADTFYADTRWRQYYADFGAYGGLMTLADDTPLPQRLKVLRHVATGRMVIAEWHPNTWEPQDNDTDLAPSQNWWLATLGASGEEDNACGYAGGSVPDYETGGLYAPHVPPGYELVGWESEVISQETAVRYVRRLVGINDDEILAGHASIDFPTGTWAVVYRAVPLGYPAGNPQVETRFYVVWWGNPTVQRVSGRWANQSMVALLKLFAMVSGRWLRFVGDEVSFIPRGAGAGFMTLPPEDNALSLEQKVGTSSPAGSIDIEVLDRSSAESMGLDYTAGRVSALQYAYVDRFAGVSTETRGEWLVDDAPAGLQLLAEDASLGILTELDYSTDGRRFRVLALQEGQ